MGTRFEVVLPADDPEALRPAGEAALAEIEEWHRRLTRFEPDSQLNHLHRAAEDARVNIDRDLYALLEDCVTVWRASGGAFDPALGSGMDAVELDPAQSTVRFTRPGVTLDLGGIAKGHALDHAAQVLRQAGVTSALLHGGTSSVVAVGHPPGGAAWKVALAGSGNPPTVVTLTDQALGTSSQFQRQHVADPRTGTLIKGARLAAVIGPSARLCDAWSTALLVLGQRPAAMPAGYEDVVIP
jgi:thiamine biosynthesis lipoprotein